MAAPIIELTLIPAPNDPPLRSSKYQKGLHRFADSLNAAGIKYGFGLDLIEAAAPDVHAPVVLTGVFTLAKVSLPVVGGFLAGWLKGRSKRKVRIAVGPHRISAEAQTVEDVERLLNKAAEYQEVVGNMGKRKVKGHSTAASKKVPTKTRKKR